jgi:integrase/recombinase XerD
MDSRQGNRYIKNRMGNDLKQKILEYNGITSQLEPIKNKCTAHICGRCQLKNALENKYCNRCSYPLVLNAFEEEKKKEQELLEIKKYNSLHSEAIEVLSDRLSKALEEIESINQRK